MEMSKVWKNQWKNFLHQVGKATKRRRISQGNSEPSKINKQE